MAKSNKHSKYLYQTCVHSVYNGGNCSCDLYSESGRYPGCRDYENDGTYEDYDEYCDVMSEFEPNYCCASCMNCGYWNNYFGCKQGMDKRDFNNYYECCSCGDIW